MSKIFARGRVFFIVFILVVAGLSAQARDVGVDSQCPTLLTKRTGWRIEPYQEQKVGGRVYSQILGLMEDRTGSLREVIFDPRHQDWTQKTLLRFLRDDRRRIYEGLIEIADTLPQSDPHRAMILKVVDKIERVEQGGAERSQWKRMLDRYGRLSTLQVALEYDRNNAYSDLVTFTGRYWAITRSYLAELLTAFEVKGVYALGVKIHELIDPEYKKEFLDAFSLKGDPSLLDLEIDVAAFDPVRKRQFWIEVKDRGRRLSLPLPHFVEGYWKKKAKLDHFLSIVKSDEVLRKAFPYEIEFHWLIRGEGIDENARNYLLREKGLVTHDRSVDSINAMFGDSGKTQVFRLKKAQ